MLNKDGLSKDALLLSKKLKIEFINGVVEITSDGTGKGRVHVRQVLDTMMRCQPRLGQGRMTSDLPSRPQTLRELGLAEKVFCFIKKYSVFQWNHAFIAEINVKYVH